MATLTATNPRAFKGHMETAKVLIENGESWNPGEFLRADTSGLLNACASDTDSGTGGAQYQSLTTQADPGNSTTYAKVAVLTSDIVFIGNELDGTISGANIGQLYGLDVTSNVHTIDVGDTSNPFATLTDVVSINIETLRNTTSDVKARLLFTVLPAVINATRAG